MAAITRTFTGIARVPPTRSISPSCSTRSSFTWRSSGRSPISSRKMVPPSASSKRPIFRAMAPVKAPFSWPKSSLSTSDGEIAPQLTVTSDPPPLGLRWWMARAMSSFPVPVSPVMSTVESVGATCRTCPSNSSSGALRPTISSNPWCCFTSSRRYTFSAWSRSRSCATSANSLAFWMAMAACDASTWTTSSRSAVNTPGVRLFSR